MTWNGAETIWGSLCLLAFVMATASSASAAPTVVEMAQPENVIEGLPRVLLIGDSISIGYTQNVRERLAGKANVYRPPVNCASTREGMEKLAEWLGKDSWDVIHFNWGLHDLKYVGADGANLADPTDPANARKTYPALYETNMRSLVARLKETDATLLWAATTPVPEGSAGRVPGDEVAYNAIAAKVMKEAEVATNDLHALAMTLLESIQRPKNVHFTEEGSAFLGARVAEVITKALDDRIP